MKTTNRAKELFRHVHRGNRLGWHGEKPNTFNAWGYHTHKSDDGFYYCNSTNAMIRGTFTLLLLNPATDKCARRLCIELMRKLIIHPVLPA